MHAHARRTFHASCSRCSPSLSETCMQPNTCKQQTNQPAELLPLQVTRAPIHAAAPGLQGTAYLPISHDYMIRYMWVRPRCEVHTLAPSLSRPHSRAHTRSESVLALSEHHGQVLHQLLRNPGRSRPAYQALAVAGCAMNTNIALAFLGFIVLAIGADAMHYFKIPLVSVRPCC